MTTDSKTETLGFQAEVQQLLELMIHSLYSNKEIFLRELISNASDAADKLRFEALQDDSLFEDDPKLRVRVEYNRENRTISVIDNGIGMSRQEAVDHLGTIAKSGTAEFFKALTGDKARDSRLIGQFGVGFYSSFIVAGKVEVTTRRAGLPRSEGVRWTSDGQSGFTVETVDRPRRGTRVTLYLREGEEEFLDGARLRSVIRRYSDHISIPIVMDREGDEKGEETVNSAMALWARPKKEIRDDEYKEFYKHVAHDFEDPLLWSHNKVEGKLEYTSLLFIPGRAQFDLWDRQQRHGIKLYVRRVFIMDDAEQLLPAYLRFVRGIVDSDDLPLNVSREILQHNKTIDSIRSGCTRKVLEMLADLAEKQPENYSKFWMEFGRVLKEGIIDDPDREADLAKLFRFASTHDESAGQSVSLAEYVQRMREGQKKIFYITGDSQASVSRSPHLEIFRKQGIEVLLLSDPVDEWVTAHLTEFDGKPLQSVTRGELELEELGAPDSTEVPEAKADPELGDLAGRIKSALGEQIRDVRVTRRLTSSAACLVSGQQDLGRHLERILEASGQQIERGKPVLEINPGHPLLKRMQLESDDQYFRDWCGVLLDQAILSEGGQLQDPAAFVQRVNNLLLHTGVPDVQA